MSATPYSSSNDNLQGPPRRWNWRKTLAWIAGAAVGLVVLVAIAATALLHSGSFRQRVLRTAAAKAQAALGVPVHAKDFSVHFNGPTNIGLDLYGVTVPGAAPYPNPPLLQVDHIGVGVHVTSFLHRTWYLQNLRVDHPVAKVFVDAKGASNVPQFKSGGDGRSDTNAFTLGVRHALLDRGEVYYNDRKTVLGADLHELRFQAAYDAARQRYAGAVGYKDGRLQYGSYEPVPHDFDATFAATPHTFTLERAVLASGPSRATLAATVQNYDTNPRVQARYDVVIDAGEFRGLLKNPSMPTGVVRTSGTIDYQGQANRPALDAVTLRGDLSSALLAERTPTLQAQMRDLGAHYTLAGGNLDVPDLHARLLGGELRGALAVKDVAGASRSKLHATLRGVSLADAQPLAGSSALRTVALGGSLNADADAAWGKTLDDLVARANATLRATVAPQSARGNTVPLDAVLHAGYAAKSKELTLANSTVTMRHTSLAFNGTVSDRSSLALRLRSNDLHELETVADLFRTPTPGGPAQPLDLYGTAAFTGDVRGSTTAPRLAGQLTASNLRVKGTSWRLLRANVTASPSGASLENGLLQPADRGRVAFDVAARLHQWSFTDTSPFQVRLNAGDLNVAEFARLAGAGTPITGTLSANVVAHGTELSPVGQGTVALTHATVSNEPVQSATLAFQGTGDEVHGDAALTLPAGVAKAVFSYAPRREAYTLRLNADGIQLDKLQAVRAKHLNVSGVLSLDADGRGTVQDPQLAAALRIPHLVVQGQAVDRIALDANVANHVATVALDSQAVNTYVRGRGTVRLEGDYPADATLDTQAIPLKPLVAAYAPAEADEIGGETELHATLHGPIKDAKALTAHVTIPVLHVSYGDKVQIGAANPIRIDYAGGVLTLQRAAIRGTDTDLEVQASVPADSAKPLSLLLQGTVNLQLAQLFSPDITSSGELRFDINSYGERTDPNIQGRVRVVNANFAGGDLPLGLQNGNGVLTLTKNRLDITSFEGTVGGGTVKASGGVTYRPSLQFDMAVAADRVRTMIPQGVREGASGNLTLTGTPEAAVLGGQMRLDELSFTPDFDVTSLLGQFSSGTVPPPPQGFSQNLQLNLGLSTPNGVNLVSRTLSLQGTANLQVRGTAAQPVILGRVNLNGGDLIFNGNRYVLQAGTLDFANPMETEPVVNVAVNTTINQYDIHLRFNGPVDQLRTNYSSDPSLPPADIINLLAFGQTTEASAANPTPGNLSAISTIASGVSSQITSRIEKIAGISQLSISPVLGGNGSQTNPGAVVTIQQRVTGNLFITFSTNVATTQNQVIQGQYKLSPRVSISGTRDQNGGFAVDTLIHRNW